MFLQRLKSWSFGRLGTTKSVTTSQIRGFRCASNTFQVSQKRLIPHSINPQRLSFSFQLGISSCFLLKDLKRFYSSSSSLYEEEGKVKLDFSTLNFFKRSHQCNEIDVSLIGQNVDICGFISSKRIFGNLLFLVLRDESGEVQIVQDNSSLGTELNSVINTLKQLNLESVIYVNGLVRARPENMKNSSMKTGDIEVVIHSFHLLNPSDLLPFEFKMESQLAREDLRLKYRFLDLRRPTLQHNLRVRSLAAHTCRSYLIDQGFVEIETPTLFKKTVESGAKEFLVPTRQRGKFYSLPQSPQQYKQILMASGFEKYFQIARCYRDEGMRGDRQPEFTQVQNKFLYLRF